MLVYRFVTHRMDCVSHHSWAQVHAAIRRLLSLTVLLGTALSISPLFGAAQQIRPPSPAKGQVAELEAKTQTRQGDVTTADGDVDIRYGDTRLRADHVEYNDKTNEAVATGHVQLDYNGEHLEATEAHYNVSTGHGLFQNVHGTFKVVRQPNEQVLLTDNPLYFQARTVERFAGDFISCRGPGSPSATRSIPSGSSTRPRHAFASTRPSRWSTPISVYFVFRSCGFRMRRHPPEPKSASPVY